jgi:uncharacterized protein (TIGR03435 family)
MKGDVYWPEMKRVLVLLLWSGVVFAQGPQFEVASVKRAEGGGPVGDIPRNMDSSPGHFAMRNVPLRYALEWAYDLKDWEISGPEWIKADERFDIIAKASGPSTDDQMRPMLQALLIERLQMKVHRETRDLNCYVLIPGKGAPKVKQAASDEPQRISGGAGGASFQNFPLSRLTFLLSRRLDRPVLDQSGLKGNFDYTVDISGLPGPQGVTDPAAPSIFTTVQRDLGLKLEARKEPISVLVVDQANKTPTAN